MVKYNIICLCTESSFSEVSLHWTMDCSIFGVCNIHTLCGFISFWSHCCTTHSCAYGWVSCWLCTLGIVVLEVTPQNFKPVVTHDTYPVRIIQYRVLSHSFGLLIWKCMENYSGNMGRYCLGLWAHGFLVHEAINFTWKHALTHVSCPWSCLHVCVDMFL